MFLTKSMSLPVPFKITVTNVAEEETVCHSLFLLKGQIFKGEQRDTIFNDSDKIFLYQYFHNQASLSPTVWPVVNGEFKCIVNLLVGKNEITLEYCGIQHKCFIQYNPRRTLYRIMPIYIICKEHNGHFQAPCNEDNSVQSACSRIALGARIIQCLTAEKLCEAGLGRKTFQLEKDLNSQASDCTVYYSKLSYQDARKMNAEDLWNYFERELMTSLLYSKYRKFLAFLSCTQYTSLSDEKLTYEDMLTSTEAYVAYGGGSLALFGTACLYTWPSNVNDIVPKFLDTTKVSNQFMDDSCYRGTHGGCFSTTLGSVLHELAHTFDVGHAAEGIMSRGFDNINLVFTNQEENDNNRRNRNLTFPNVNNNAHHATVTFSKILNLTYSVSSPIRRVNNNKLYSSTSNISAEKSCARNERRLSSSSLSQKKPEINQNSHSLRIPKQDLTFWDKSSAVLLAFHKWFNDELENSPSCCLTYNKETNELSSSEGIRVVEIRDHSGFILRSWQFCQDTGHNTFTVPKNSLAGAEKIVAEDSFGNILYIPLNIT